MVIIRCIPSAENGRWRLQIHAMFTHPLPQILQPSRLIHDSPSFLRLKSVPLTVHDPKLEIITEKQVVPSTWTSFSTLNRNGISRGGGREGGRGRSRDEVMFYLGHRQTPGQRGRYPVAPPGYHHRCLHLPSEGCQLQGDHRWRCLWDGRPVLDSEENTSLIEGVSLTSSRVSVNSDKCEQSVTKKVANACWNNRPPKKTALRCIHVVRC